MYTVCRDKCYEGNGGNLLDKGPLEKYCYYTTHIVHVYRMQGQMLRGEWGQSTGERAIGKVLLLYNTYSACIPYAGTNVKRGMGAIYWRKGHWKSTVTI